MAAKMSLEERRLALDEQTAWQDLELKKMELELKRGESTWPARIFTPDHNGLCRNPNPCLFITGTLMQGQGTLELEREKFESARKLERRRGQRRPTLGGVAQS